jgi:hypothetical protein
MIRPKCSRKMADLNNRSILIETISLSKVNIIVHRYGKDMT